MVVPGGVHWLDTANLCLPRCCLQGLWKSPHQRFPPSLLYKRESCRLTFKLGFTQMQPQFANILIVPNCRVAHFLSWPFGCSSSGSQAPLSLPFQANHFKLGNFSCLPDTLDGQIDADEGGSSCCLQKGLMMPFKSIVLQRNISEFLNFSYLATGQGSSPGPACLFKPPFG